MSVDRKHTAGAWTIEEGSRGTTVIIGEDSDGGTVVLARLPDWPAQKDQQDANARLISAATAMLKELDDQTDWLNTIAEALEETLSHPQADLVTARGCIIAALAKLTEAVEKATD